MGLAPQNGIIPILAIGGLLVVSILGLAAWIVELIVTIAWMFS